MSHEPIISVSGLRGVVGASLTIDVARRYVDAFCQTLAAGPVVVARDGRANGPAIAAAVREAVVAAGRDCLDAGVAATPTVGVLVRTAGAAGGIQISASHNPPEYNGIKLFSAAGRVIPAGEGARVLERYMLAREEARTGAEPPARRSGTLEPGVVTQVPDPTGAHLELVAAVCDVARIRRRRFRVLLDANHGAGGVLGRPLLEHLGCQVAMLGGKADGRFAHPPEPTEANLASVLEQVEQYSAHIGFCQDPDADRLAVMDERGRYLGEEKTLAMCVDHVLRSGRRGAVVTNCSTSRMTEDLAAHYGVPCFRSKVGEANVVDLMLEQDAVIGGEGNGGVIDPRVVLVRDSFAGMALVLDAMSARDLPASALADELPRYAIHKSAIQLPAERVQAALAAIEGRFPQATASRLDGLRLDFAGGAWLLVRPSNTEPIVRAIAEAATAHEARHLCDEAAQVMA